MGNAHAGTSYCGPEGARCRGVGSGVHRGVYPRPKTVEDETPDALSGSLVKPPALPVVLTADPPKGHPEALPPWLAATVESLACIDSGR